MYRLGAIQEKILLVLLTGLALGASSSPNTSYRALREARKEWQRVDQRNFNRSLRKLTNAKLLKERRLPDGSHILELTKEGKRQARLQVILGRSIHFKHPKKWDGKWRVVSFDIPEDDKDFRHILRSHLYALDFHRLQLSMFISPHPHEKQLRELVDLYNATPYVRIMTVGWIDNQDELKKYFFKAKGTRANDR